MGFATHLGPYRLGTIKEGAARNCGVNVVSQSNTVAYTDTTAKSLFILPAGSQVLSIYIDVITAFNSSGTEVLDVGKTGDGAFFVNDQTLTATGHFVATLVPANLATIVNVGTTDIQVTATFVQSVADATTGLARVTCLYAVKDSDGNENPPAATV
jgi:hypothetical protein